MPSVAINSAETPKNVMTIELRRSSWRVLLFTSFIVAMPFTALGGGTVMTMAYALLMPLMPDDAHGALTGRRSRGAEHRGYS